MRRLSAIMQLLLVQHKPTAFEASLTMNHSTIAG